VTIISPVKRGKEKKNITLRPPTPHVRKCWNGARNLVTVDDENKENVRVDNAPGSTSLDLAEVDLSQCGGDLRKIIFTLKQDMSKNTTDHDVLREKNKINKQRIETMENELEKVKHGCFWKDEEHVPLLTQREESSFKVSLSAYEKVQLMFWY